MAEIISFLSNASVITLLVGYVFAIWLGLVVWTWVDIARRSDNIFYRYAMVLLVAFGAFVGFAFYLMIRPSLTKKEVEAQSLEERFLLSTSNFAICANCGQVSREDFVFCITCGNKLKDKCTNCGTLMNLEWLACPNCGQLKAKTLEPASVEVLESSFGNLSPKKLPMNFNFSSFFASLAHLVPQPLTEEKKGNGDSRKTHAKKTSSKKSPGTATKKASKTSKRASK